MIAEPVSNVPDRTTDADTIALIKQVQDMVTRLSDNQVRQVFSLTASLIEANENPFEPITKQQVLDDIRESKAEFAAGKGQDASMALSDIRAEFGI